MLTSGAANAQARTKFVGWPAVFPMVMSQLVRLKTVKVRVTFDHILTKKRHDLRQA
jgi:hypothetical protein